MPTLTPKLGLQKPLGNEMVNRAAYNENLDIIDSAAASQAEVTNHKAADILDHPDGSVTDAKIGNRTISDATAPTGDTGTLTSLLGSLAYMIKTITGKASWKTAPAMSLETVAGKFDGSTGHGHTGASGDGPKIDADRVDGYHISGIATGSLTISSGSSKFVELGPVSSHAFYLVSVWCPSINVIDHVDWKIQRSFYSLGRYIHALVITNNTGAEQIYYYKVLKVNQ